MSPDTLRFFEELLQQIQISAGAENFEELAARVSQVRLELKAALAA